MKTCIKIIILLFLPILSFADTSHPKLIVQLVVDQLRGDLIEQHRHHFGKDGFNYLLNHGINYQNAHHPHANTVTCVGHATIATGSYPALHGMISNNWYDRKTDRPVYCVGDSKAPILPTTRMKKTMPGRSARNLSSSTLSDEIVLAQLGRAFSVSFKDRAAITLAGHAGKAFWFDKKNGGFITSQYYYTAYPNWVTSWNDQYKATDQTWAPTYPITKYRYAKSPRFKNRWEDFNQNFPHQLQPAHTSYYKFLSMSPMADELTADYAATLLQHEKLGQSKQQTDYLAISFSATDAIGHQFGPNSIESEDNLIRLDKTLAKLFATLDQYVGLQNTVIILTADHGAPDAPPYLAEHGMTAAQPLKRQQLAKIVQQTLAKRFKLPDNALQAILFPYIYLNDQVINDHQLSLQTVREILIERLNQENSIFRVFSLPTAASSTDWLGQKVAMMTSPKRAGDIYLVSPPFQNFGTRVVHGAPWQYDSYVPLLFSNPGFKPRKINRPVATTDIAITLSQLLSIKSPSASVGNPLYEVIDTLNNK